MDWPIKLPGISLQIVYPNEWGPLIHPFVHVRDGVLITTQCEYYSHSHIVHCTDIDGTVFQTGDGRYIVFGVGTDIQFARLCEILKCQEMVHDTRFQTNAARVVHRKECVARLQQRVVEFQNRDQLVERLVASNVPVAGVNAMDEVFDIPQARDVVLMDPNDTNQASGLRQVVFHSSNQGTLPNLSVPPHYGEHTESVLTQALGMSKNEVDDLVSDGVVDAYKPT